MRWPASLAAGRPWRGLARRAPGCLEASEAVVQPRCRRAREPPLAAAPLSQQRPAHTNRALEPKGLKGGPDFGRAEGFLDFGGVRIEDDILITPRGPARDLTEVPKEIRDVEEACRR